MWEGRPADIYADTKSPVEVTYSNFFMLDLSHCLLNLSSRPPFLMQPYATATETWCAGSVSAMKAGKTLIIKVLYTIFSPRLWDLQAKWWNVSGLRVQWSLWFSLCFFHVSPSRRSSFCNCSVASASALDTSQCIGPGMTDPCSGRGDCLECGTCVCYNPDQFEGPYCQYDKTQCQRYGGFICNSKTARDCWTGDEGCTYVYATITAQHPKWILYFHIVSLCITLRT